MTRMTVLLFVLGASGCERGCLATWLAEHGVGGASPARSGRGTPGGVDPTGLTGTDCSDGLLRCVEGHVEASRAAQLAETCAKGAERGGCACPWESLLSCASGCVEEGLEVAAAADAGAQLCRQADTVARPLVPGDPVPRDVCAEEGLSCVEGIVRSCEGPGLPVQPLALCLNGCHPAIHIDHGETKNRDGVVAILCRRDHAERR